MEPTNPFAGLGVRIDTTDDPIDLVGALALQGFVSGDEPVAVARSLQRVRADAPLVPPGITPSRQAFERRRRMILATGPGWTLVAKVFWDQAAYVTVSAVSRELAEDVLDRACDGAEEPADPSESTVDMGFWHDGRHGPRRVERAVEAPEWSAITANYTHAVVRAVDALMATTEPPSSGRLLLLHGPPGTGKTTILRALARQWQPWCRMDHVVDPENLLGRSSYLLDVLADEPTPPRWRLLVLEDCDELIRADAKSGTGQSLARLLNVTDGMLGQGTKVLVCITTNEHLGRLHPAIVRPGRCLAEIEVGRLSAAEARAWLGRPTSGAPDGMTLAELFAARDGDGSGDRYTSLSTGAYL